MDQCTVFPSAPHDGNCAPMSVSFFVGKVDWSGVAPMLTVGSVAPTHGMVKRERALWLCASACSPLGEILSQLAPPPRPPPAPPPPVTRTCDFTSVPSHR